MSNEKRGHTKMKKATFISLHSNSHTYCSIQGPIFSVSCYTTVLQNKRKGFQRLLSELEGTEALKYQIRLFQNK